MKFRYRNNNLQNNLLDYLKSQINIKYRIRADRSIEFAKKWGEEIIEIAVHIANDIFVLPVIETWNMQNDYILYIHKLAEQNVQFVIEQWDEQIKIVTEDCDTEQIFEIKRQLFKN